MKFVDIKNDIAFIPTDLKDEGLKQAYEDADRHNWTIEELEAYHYAEMRRQDEKGKTTVAVRKAVRKAVEQEKNEIVKNCYKKGLSIQDTVDLTGLNIKQVEEIFNAMKNGH
jgi:hypothetical protein